MSTREDAVAAALAACGGTTGTTASATALLKNKTARALQSSDASRRAVKSLGSAPRSLTSHASTSALDILSGQGRLNRN